MNSDPTECLSEKTINNVIKKIQTVQSTLSQVVMAETTDNATLKGKLMEIFRICCQFSTITNDNDLMEYHLKIRTLLEEVEKTTAVSTIVPWLKSVDRYQQLKSLLEWAQENSARIDGVDIMHHASDSPLDNLGFGLKVTRDVKRGEEVLTIPKNLILTADYFMNDEALGEVAKLDPLLSTMPNILLAFGLLIECYKGDDSPWKVYLKSLPWSCNNVCQFSAEDFARLKGSPLYWDALSLWTSCVRQYVYLHMKFIECETTNKMLHNFSQKYQLKDKFNARDYMWAASTVMTRMNPIPSASRGSRHTLGLIPIMDLCNHKETIFSVDFDINRGVCKVLCPDDLPTGSELRIFYGARPTSLLFIYNGFYLENNPNDFFVISIDKLYSKAAISNRMDLLTAAELQDALHHPLSLYASAWSGNLRQIYRLMNCSNEEKQTLMSLSPENLRASVDGSISMETELKSLEQLKKHIELILAGYIRDDMLPPVDPNNYISVSCDSYIKNEKKILNKVLSDIDQATFDAKTLVKPH